MTQSLYGCIYAGAAILSTFYEGVQCMVDGVIQIGHSLVDSCDIDCVYQAVSRIEMILGSSSIDGWLAMQYALSLVCAEEVSLRRCTVCRYITGSYCCF